MISYLGEDDVALLSALKCAFISCVKLDQTVMKIQFILDGIMFATLELHKVVHAVISQTLDDEGPHAVGELSLSSVNDGGKEVLNALAYRFLNRDGKAFIYPNNQLYHFHTEGDICVEVVCGSYQLRRATS